MSRATFQWACAALLVTMAAVFGSIIGQRWWPEPRDRAREAKDACNEIAEYLNLEAEDEGDLVAGNISATGPHNIPGIQWRVMGPKWTCTATEGRDHWSAAVDPT